MAVTAHAFPKFIDTVNKAGTNLSAAPFTSDLKVLLTGSGTVTWNATTQGYQFVQDLLTGASLTELPAAGGYSAGGASCSSVSLSLSGLYDTIVVGVNPSWASATFTAYFAVFYSTYTGTNYSTYPLVCYWDFGGANSVSNGTFTLAMPTTNGVASSLVQWTTS